MIVIGVDKADILYKVFVGPIMLEVPLSAVHPDVTICDEAAAARTPQ